MAQPPYFAGLDVGGTSMKGGVVDDQGKPLASVSLPTEAYRGQELGLARMVETIRAAVTAAKLPMADIAAVGVATPGTMDLATGIVLDPPNLKPWQNVPVRQYVHDALQLPTAFQNDANAAAFGEYWAGAGRGANSMVLFTLGTGVGGGIVIGDKVLVGEHSHGAELGHVRIEITHPRQCGCGRMGCLEAYASATAVVKRTLEALAANPGQSSLHQLLKRDEEITSRAVFTAAATGDSLAAKIVEETAYYLAVAAVNMMHTIDPNMVVFAGGMIAAGEPFLERIRHHVKQMAFPILAAATKICYAQLGTDAGFIGAAGCGRLDWKNG
jgi:glucokinase